MTGIASPNSEPGVPPQVTRWTQRTLPAALCVAASCLSAAASQAGPGEAIRGQARIIDGDSLEVAGRNFDLAGIDAPELGQRCQSRQRLYDCGSLALAALMDLTAGVEVECRTLAGGAGGVGERSSARCSAGGYDLSEGMIYTGWALLPPGEPGGAVPATFSAIQAQADAKQRGLWKGSFVTPWEWRQGIRLPQE